MNTSTARIGHSRVSTSDQNPAAQVAALEAAGCTMIRTETGSGTSLENRPELKVILDFIHPGETLVVTRIDRLARSMKDLQVIVAKLRERGANIAATEQPVDTSTAAGKAFFDMLGVFAEFETNLRRERQAEGIVAARRRVSIADDLRRSTWTKSGPELPKGSRRPGSRARWESRAEPSTRPKARPESMARPLKVRWKSGKTPPRRRHEHRDLFAGCSSRCPNMQLRSV